jgi:tellurite resistance protein TerC
VGDSARETPAAGRARTAAALRVARKVAVAAAGLAVLAVGVALIVLPGPAVLVIPAGLAILATEFPWARRLLRVGKERVSALLARARALVAVRER